MNRELIRRFVEDKATSTAVYEMIRSIFLRRRKMDDVQTLAAERLALFLLEDAIGELDRLGLKDVEAREQSNPGV